MVRANDLAYGTPAHEVPGIRQSPWLSRMERNALLLAARKRGRSRDAAVITALFHNGRRVSDLGDMRLADLGISDQSMG